MRTYTAGYTGDLVPHVTTGLDSEMRGIEDSERERI